MRGEGAAESGGAVEIAGESSTTWLIGFPHRCHEMREIRGALACGIRLIAGSAEMRRNTVPRYRPAHEQQILTSG